MSTNDDTERSFDEEDKKAEGGASTSGSQTGDDKDEKLGGGVDALIRSFEGGEEDQETKDFNEEYFIGPFASDELGLLRAGHRRRKPPLFRDLVDEYSTLWAELAIRQDRLNRVKNCVEHVVATRRAYEAVENQTGVPWYVVGAIHNLESSLNFRKHLHNGDPLTARTVNVPSGRPREGKPPFTWMESAADALTYKGISGISDWSIA